MPKTLSDIERELAAVTAEANAKKKRLRNERVRIQRRENEALGAALRAAGFEGAPDDVAALVSLARAAEKHGENVSAKGDEDATEVPEKPAESKAPETPKPTPAPAPEKPNPVPASAAPKPAQTAPTPFKPALKPEAPATKAEASTSGAVSRLMKQYANR